MIRFLISFAMFFSVLSSVNAADDTAVSHLFSDQRLYIGVGADNVSNKDFDATAYGMIEWASEVKDDTWGLRHRLSADVSGVGYWAGFGFSIEKVFDGTPYYVEASTMMGAYTDAGGHDLGVALEFRSQLMFGYIFDNGSDIAVGIAHKSNANLGDKNPGTETVYVRYGTNF